MDRNYPGACFCCAFDPCSTLDDIDTLTVAFSGITTCPGSTGSVGGSYTLTRADGFTYDSGGAVITNAFGAQYKLVMSVGCVGFSADHEQVALGVEIALIPLMGGIGYALASGTVNLPFGGGTGSWTGQDAFCSSGSPAQGLVTVTVSA